MFLQVHSPPLSLPQTFKTKDCKTSAVLPLQAWPRDVRGLLPPGGSSWDLTKAGAHIPSDSMGFPSLLSALALNDVDLDMERESE